MLSIGILVDFFQLPNIYLFIYLSIYLFFCILFQKPGHVRAKNSSALPLATAFPNGTDVTEVETVPTSPTRATAQVQLAVLP